MLRCRLSSPAYIPLNLSFLILLLLLLSTFHPTDSVEIHHLTGDKAGPLPIHPGNPSYKAADSDRSEEDKIKTVNSKEAPDSNTANLDTTKKSGENLSNTEAKSPGAAALEAARNASVQQPQAQAQVKCGEGACEELSEALLEAVEGTSCRSLFLTGKCPGVCANAISVITKNATWPECATTCSGDVVTGAAERWVELCDARKETLIEQGKEAVKSIHQGIAQSVHARVVIHFFVGVLILVLGAVYGYRRGVISAAMAYRLQKRRLGGRKNSDDKLPL